MSVIQSTKAPKNLNQDGTPRFIPVPFSEYLKVTRPCPKNNSTLKSPPLFRSPHKSVLPTSTPFPLQAIIPSTQGDLCPPPPAKRQCPSTHATLFSQSSTSLPQNPPDTLPTIRKRSAPSLQTQGDLYTPPLKRYQRPSRYESLFSQSLIALPQNTCHPLPTNRKRSAPILPHQYCSNCWKFGSEVGSHWVEECPAPGPIPCPTDFAAQREAACLSWGSSGRLGRVHPNPDIRKCKRARKAPLPLSTP